MSVNGTPDEFLEPEIQDNATLPVVKNGGMSVEGIRLYVMGALSMNNRVLLEGWEKKMDKHTEKVENRLDDHEKKVSLRLDSQDSKLNEILAEVKAGRKQGDDWHEQDLKYRAGVQEWRNTQEPKIDKLVTDVKTVQDAQLDINTKFNLIQWLVLFCKGLSWTSEKAVVVSEKGKKVSASLAAIFSGTVFVWSFFRPGGILEYINVWFRGHFH